jgi:hypothetical protein
MLNLSDFEYLERAELTSKLFESLLRVSGMACILSRPKFTKRKPVPSSADGHMPFPSLIGEFERPDHIIMAFESFDLAFFC